MRMDYFALPGISKSETLYCIHIRNVGKTTNFTKSENMKA